MKKRYLLTAILSLLLSCQPQPTEREQTYAHALPPQERNQFTTTCIEEYGSHEVCRCAFQEVELAYDAVGYQAFANQINRNKKLPLELHNIVKSCTHDLATRDLCVGKTQPYQYTLDPSRRLHVRGSAKTIKMIKKNEKSFLKGKNITIEYEGYVNSRRIFIYSHRGLTKTNQPTIKTFISHEFRRNQERTTELNCRTAALSYQNI